MPASRSSDRRGRCSTARLIEAGIDRKQVYVTNAVKHFKFVPRGKIRLHQKPSTPEIKACRPWYERELAAIKPALVVAMGATAAQSVFGKITPINKNRGRLIDLDDGTKALVTVHPSYLLRLPDEDAKAREYERFVDDLKIAAAVAKISSRGLITSNFLIDNLQRPDQVHQAQTDPLFAIPAKNFGDWIGPSEVLSKDFFQ